jgi:hypothetical protein
VGGRPYGRGYLGWQEENGGTEFRFERISRHSTGAVPLLAFWAIHDHRHASLRCALAAFLQPTCHVYAHSSLAVFGCMSGSYLNECLVMNASKSLCVALVECKALHKLQRFCRKTAAGAARCHYYYHITGPVH